MDPASASNTCAFGCVWPGACPSDWQDEGFILALSYLTGLFTSSPGLSEAPGGVKPAIITSAKHAVLAFPHNFLALAALSLSLHRRCKGPRQRGAVLLIAPTLLLVSTVCLVGGHGSCQ